MRRWVAFTSIFASIALTSADSFADDKPGVHLDVPTIETSLLGGIGRPWPGMHQSLWLATDGYQLVHFGVGEAFGLGSRVGWKEFVSRLLIGVSDIALIQLPPGQAWQHEEWHRAVLSNQGLTSYNDVYNFDFGASAIAVSHVTDEGLVRLKRAHPADLVRLSTAGFEANYELATNLEKTQFFAQTRAWNLVALWQLYAANFLYLRLCASKDVNSWTDTFNNSDGANVSKRDFTGADCTAWTYDLFRPEEPYEARGVHPSGVGINRYRKLSDLSAEEQDYLRTERNLSLLNALDPALLGIVDFRSGALRWNAHVRYMPTAFGSTLDLDGFFAHRGRNLFLTLHLYRNHERVFPGLSAELLRLPLRAPWGSPGLLLSARANAWLQPEDSRFLTSNATPGGLLGVRLGFAVSRYAEPYVELDAKSPGWVAGNVHLDSALVVRAGFTSTLF